MKVGIAYPTFKSSFDHFFPGLEVVDLAKISQYGLIVFSGGEDINPRIYGEENRYSYFNDRRDEVEVAVLRAAVARNIKIVGTCRGHQLINALLGGHVVQDILIEVGQAHGGGHSLEWSYGPMLKELKTIFPSSVNSMHHQGVNRNGNGLSTLAKYGGVSEITVGNNIITTQFHPEWMSEGAAFFKFVFDWANATPETTKVVAQPITLPNSLKASPIEDLTGNFEATGVIASEDEAVFNTLNGITTYTARFNPVRDIRFINALNVEATVRNPISFETIEPDTESDNN